MWAAKKKLEILFRSSVQTQKNLGRYNEGIIIDGDDFFKYVLEKENAKNQVKNGSNVLDSIRKFLPYLPRSPSMREEPVDIITRHGKETKAYEIKNQKMYTLDMFVKDEVEKMKPAEYDEDFINSLKNFNNQYYVLRRDFYSHYGKSFPEIIEKKELDEKLKTENDEYILVNINWETLEEIYKTMPEELEVFGVFNKVTVYELKEGVEWSKLKDRTSSYIFKFMEEITPANVEDLIYSSTYKTESIDDIYYKPEIPIGATALLADGKIYILDIGITASYVKKEDDDIKNGKWIVKDVQNIMGKLHLTLKKYEEEKVIILETGNLCKTWRFNKNIDKIDRSRNFYTKYDFTFISKNIIRNMEEESKDWKKDSYKDVLYKYWFSKLPDLQSQWKEDCKKILQMILTGRLAFTAASLVHSDYYSFDWKLENWGLIPLSEDTTVHIPLSKDTDETLDIYVGNKYGLSLIDHEYMSKSSIKQELHILMKNSIDIYSDGDTYMRQTEGNSMIVNPFSLQHHFFGHKDYPYKLTFPSLTNYIVTNTIEYSDGGKSFVDKYTGPNTIASALRQRYKDLKEKGYLLEP